ncbi:hypothetical protein AB0K35_28430 [Micromonospora sp. NPDC053740]|uniref:hypothetical protein n=1 Tax=Micromonospora sp. NPDC053740 TaxID=3155173 RepID=UPI003435539D
MPVEFHAATPIEVYTITAADYLTAVAVGFVLVLAAAGFAAWVFSAGTGSEPTPPEVDARAAAETVELPEEVRRRSSGPRTGNLHGPVYHRSADDTVVIKPAGTRR